MRVRFTKVELYSFFICAGFLFFPFYLRNLFLPFNLACVNIISFIGIACFLLNSHIFITFKIKKYYLFVFYVVLSVLLALNFNFEKSDIILFFSYFISWILPIFIIFLKVKDRFIFMKIFKVWIKLLNFMVYFITLCFILDRFLGFNFSQFFMNLYSSSSSVSMTIEMVGERMVSFFGHPLYTTEIILIYYICNYLYGNYTDEQNSPIIYTLVSLFTIGLTGGKTGIVLISFLIMFHNFQNKRFKYFFIMIFIFSFLYALGIFDTVIERFIEGLESGDITSARSSSWNKLFSSGKYQMDLFKGQIVIDSSNSTLIAALEYPILRWSFLCGAIFSITLSLILFFVPIIKILKTKQFNILICLIVLIIDINTFNTISTQRDALFLYCWFIFLLTNITYFAKERKDIL